MADATHRYRATCRWEGRTGEGYAQYSRTHTLEVVGVGGALTLSSDPAFRGDAGLLNPEQLLLAAAASCQLLSFLAVAARARIDVLRYADDAEAEMPEGARPIWITRITLRPQVAVAAGPTEARVRQLLEVAHGECFIANSLRSEIILEPSVTLVG